MYGMIRFVSVTNSNNFDFICNAHFSLYTWFCQFNARVRFWQSGPGLNTP